jgi:RHS repeat-associated protein
MPRDNQYPANDNMYQSQNAMKPMNAFGVHMAFKWQNFTYDSAGNATKEANESNSTLRAYKYDMEGRLAEMTDPRNVGYKVTFTYDGMGRRILQASTTNGFTSYKRYQWCGSTLCQQRDNGTGRKRRYFATGEYVYADGATPAKKYVYFQDQLGSVRDLVDADTGARVGALDYTPYGQVRDSYGVLPDYRYAGLFWVGEVGLNASATRFYDGSTMRWMTRDWDKAAGLLNGYNYANGNPLMRIDPNGTDWKTGIDGAALGGGLSAIAVGGLAVISSPAILAVAALAGGASLTYGIAETISAYQRGCDDEGDRLLGGLLGGAIVGGFGSWGLSAKGLTSADFLAIADTISQKQFRHILGRGEYRGGGYLDNTADAQAVLDGYHSGSVKIIGSNQQGFPIVHAGNVTGTNVNIGAGYPNKSTNVFIIKGTTSPSVVPANPNWKPK